MTTAERSSVNYRSLEYERERLEMAKSLLKSNPELIAPYYYKFYKESCDPDSKTGFDELLVHSVDCHLASKSVIIVRHHPEKSVRDPEAYLIKQYDLQTQHVFKWKVEDFSTYDDFIYGQTDQFILRDSIDPSDTAKLTRTRFGSFWKTNGEERLIGDASSLLDVMYELGLKPEDLDAQLEAEWKERLRQRKLAESALTDMRTI